MLECARHKSCSMKWFHRVHVFRPCSVHRCFGAGDHVQEWGVLCDLPTMSIIERGKVQWRGCLVCHFWLYLRPAWVHGQALNYIALHLWVGWPCLSNIHNMYIYILYIMCFSLSNAAVIDKMSNAATTIPPSCLLIPIQHTSSAPWLTRSHRASDGKPSWLVSAGLPGSAWSRWYQATKTDFEQESKNAINAILVFR